MKMEVKARLMFSRMVLYSSLLPSKVMAIVNILSTMQTIITPSKYPTYKHGWYMS
jgi:hypothetical protein